MSGKNLITKPAIASDIAVYTLRGDIDKRLMDAFFGNLEQHRVILRSLKVQAVLFSMKEITSIGDEELSRLYKRLEELNGELKIPTGFCYYTSKQFAKLKKETENSSIALVKTPKVASLVMGTARISKSDTILVYEDDVEEKNLMFSEFISKGFSVVAAKDRADFKKRALEKHKYGVIVRESRLSGIYKSVFITVSKGFYTYIFRGYIDESLANIFNAKAHKNRLLDGFKGFMLDFSKVTAVHVRAAFFLKEIGKLTSDMGGGLYIFGVDEKRLSTNIVEILKNSDIHFFNTQEECIADAIAGGYERKPLDLDEEQGVALTKEVVTNIPVFAKSVINTIGVFAGAKGQKKMARTRVADMLKKPIFTTGMIAIDGDISATLFFMTSKTLMQRVAKTMLDEESIDEYTALDLTSEIMNTIGGKIKMMIAEQNMPISISLPKAYNSKEELKDTLGNREGIGIELSIEDDKFYLFLVGSVLLQVL